ncbi:MAG TPA: ATP-binding cassette domain-containing protein [Candidatus Acidoferrum sp.]|nr:ATP-binding cassette domain-containing protein [Candidatus Acidoferrum sp.]
MSTPTDLPLAIECEGLVRTFKTVRALAGVGFEVQQGEVFGLLGPNGAGKTTTIRILVTLLRPNAGQARVFGIDVTQHPMAVRRCLGYVPQQLSADAGLTGYENVSLFARLFDVAGRHRHERVMDALDAMGLSDAATRLAGRYSGGMIRRLELAQALVNEPRLLVLDEPTIGLDPVARADVWERLLNLRDSLGTTVLITTHYMEEADQLCDRVALIHRGEVRAIGAPEALKTGLGKTATLEDVFRHFTGDHIDDQGNFKDVRAIRRTARRLG